MLRLKNQAALFLNSIPQGAHVFLNNKNTGKITPVKLTLDKGTHLITFKKDEYYSDDQIFTLNKQQTLKFESKLEKRMIEMVRIPAGRLTIRDAGSSYDISIKSFNMMTKEVTFNQYDEYANATGAKLPKDEGFGRGSHPVLNVTWSDVQKFAEWLNKKTGKLFRLPSETQWEYAARGGTKTLYAWGNDINCSLASYSGGQNSTCYYIYNGAYRGTAKVGSFPPNKYGLYDMHGNVYEWVQDCWNNNYNGVPNNGEARIEGDCSTHVVRGGHWADPPENLQSYFRTKLSSGEPGYIGFRLIHD